jgi:hypothetical protein
MSRLDNLGEILDSYENRKEEPEVYNSVPLFVQYGLKEDHEEDYRMGLLVGKSLGDRFRIDDIFVPDQDSNPSRTMVVDWKDALDKAKAMGELAGVALYTGKNDLIIPDATKILHKKLCKNHGMKYFIYLVNNEGYFKIFQDGKETSSGRHQIE